MADFRTAHRKTLIEEGKYADLKGDKGGKTMYGVTHKTAKAYGIKDVKKVTQELSFTIGKKNFWIPLKLDKIKEQYIAEQIYDQAYNSGTRAAGKILQKAINEYFEIRGSNRTLKIDGLIGTNTLKAYNKVRYKRVLLALIMAHRIARYKLLAKVPTQKRFLPSWLRRVVGTIGAHI